MPFKLQLRVEAAEIDELDHVSNLVYLRWALEAAAAHSASVGLTIADYLRRGVAFVVTRHEIDYLSPAVAGDAIEVETRVSAMTVATAERGTAIRRRGDGVLLARAVTRFAYFDLKSRRPARIPDDVRKRFPVEAEAETNQPTRRRA